MNEARPTLDHSECMGHAAVKFAAGANAGETDFGAFLNRLNCGVIVVRRCAGVSAVNACAQEFLGEDLMLSEGRLCVASRPHQQRLDEILRRSFERHLDAFECVIVPRRCGQRPLLLQIAPLAYATPIDAPPGATEATAASALIMIFDFDRDSRPACSAALRALGLTAAEAAVASLVGAGTSPLDAADRLGITVLTVRTHLKAIFQKLGLQRQNDLVSIVSRLSMLS